MQYLYKDFTFGRQVLRCVRLLDYPTRTGGDQPSGGFHNAGEAAEPSLQLSTHQINQLHELRNQQRLENRLVYFDIDDAHLPNPGQLMRDFEYGAVSEDTEAWAFTIGNVV